MLIITMLFYAHACVHVQWAFPFCTHYPCPCVKMDLCLCMEAIKFAIKKLLYMALWASQMVVASWYLILYCKVNNNFFFPTALLNLCRSSFTSGGSHMAR